MSKKKGTDFYSRLSDVSQEAMDFIKKSLKKGQTIVLMTEQEMEDGVDENVIYDLPYVFNVGKHGNYDEYAILSIEKKSATEIVLHTTGKGEATGDTEDFDLSETDNSNLCFLADEISKKL